MIFCDRTHTVQFINKAAKERYGDVVQVGRSIFNWDFSDPGKPVAVPKLEAGYKDKTSGAQGVKTLCAADFMCF